jgi:hypothetical protein
MRPLAKSLVVHSVQDASIIRNIERPDVKLAFCVHYTDTLRDEQSLKLPEYQLFIVVCGLR